jgi:hypothetical protein
MSYTVLSDGVEFLCRGCGRTAKTKSVSRLPKGWCVTGILAYKNEEWTEEEAPSEDVPAELLERRKEMQEKREGQKMLKLGSRFACHFHSVQCGRRFLSRPEVIAEIKKCGVTLAMWGMCDIVIDGAGMTEKPDEGGEEPPPGSPPPYEYKEGDNLFGGPHFEGKGPAGGGHEE